LVAVGVVSRLVDAGTKSYSGDGYRSMETFAASWNLSFAVSGSGLGF